MEDAVPEDQNNVPGDIRGNVSSSSSSSSSSSNNNDNDNNYSGISGGRETEMMRKMEMTKKRHSHGTSPSLPAGR